ncbi:MAG: thiamine phosphate synthase [Phycisphaerae bacterium]|nr:thiamine phosphate synthase [Phycisphaerae bacterium]
MSRAFDPFLYLVTDRDLAGARGVAEVVRLALDGGVTLVQLREKTLAHEPFVEEACVLRDICHARGVPLIVNDNIAVARQANADGVHLGQSDASVEEARETLGPDAIIGLSVESIEQARTAARLDIDYVAVSPVFATPTKTDTAAPLGLEGVRAIRRLADKPLVAIGGINTANAADVLQAGADGLAVISAIMAAADPCQAARAFRRLRSALTDPERER